MNLDSESETHQMEENKDSNSVSSIKLGEADRVKSAASQNRPNLMPSNSRENKSLSLFEKKMEAALPKEQNSRSSQNHIELEKQSDGMLFEKVERRN